MKYHYAHTFFVLHRRMCVCIPKANENAFHKAQRVDNTACCYNFCHSCLLPKGSSIVCPLGNIYSHTSAYEYVHKQHTTAARRSHVKTRSARKLCAVNSSSSFRAAMNGLWFAVIRCVFTTHKYGVNIGIFVCSCTEWLLHIFFIFHPSRAFYRISMPPILLRARIVDSFCSLFSAKAYRLNVAHLLSEEKYIFVISKNVMGMEYMKDQICIMYERLHMLFKIEHERSSTRIPPH